MRLLFVADGRSPIALNWISHFITHGDEVHLASTFPCDGLGGLASLNILPTALDRLYRSTAPGESGPASLVRRLIPVNLRTRIRQMLAPSSLVKGAESLKELIIRIQPDLIHAMRIPYEGILASQAVRLIETRIPSSTKPPLLISVWGNDFTLHARSSRSLSRLTSEVLSRADALHTDCQRDVRLAIELGFDTGKPSIVLPGNGGIRMDTFTPASEGLRNEQQINIINPRGFRSYVRNDTFFHAIPLVLEKAPATRFVCPGMKGEGQAEQWTDELGISAAVDLLPRQPMQKMAELFRQSQVMVSITTHDGTPNTLLEGMASGCFPIAGDIESLHEWIVDGENGLLVDPGDPRVLAAAILSAIDHPELRQQAMAKNLALVRQRAEYGAVMHKAEEFYKMLV